MVNFLNILLSLGLVLTTATQIRPANSPIGIGEGILILWMIVVMFKIGNFGYHKINPVFKVFCLFWLAITICLNLGFFIAFYLDVVSIDFAYNAFALGFAGVFSILFSLYLVEIKDCSQIIIWLSSFAVISQLILLLFPGLLPGIQPWYGGIRFAGWAKNPNQIAILLCIIPFLISHIFIHFCQNKLTKFWCIFLVIGVVTIGILTDSDALRNSWLSGFGILIFLQLNIKFLTLLCNNKSPYQVFVYTNIFRFILFIIIMISIVLYFQQEQSLFFNVYNKDSQGSIRVILWKNGLTAISYSPIFGLGPGFFSGISKPFLNFEAHNTFIDLTSSSGIIGLVCYLSLLSWIAKNAWDKKLLILFTSVIALVAFSSFHYVLRHPIFWFYLLSINALTGESFKAKYKILNN